MDLNRQKHRLTVKESDISGSVFENVNLSGWRVKRVDLSGLDVSNANLTGAKIVQSDYDGMTIDGIPVTEMIEAYNKAAAPEAAT